MAKYNYSDLSLTDDGDLNIVQFISEEGEVSSDIMLTTGVNELRQNIRSRIKTNMKELIMHPALGNRLLDILGERNTKENAEKGKKYLLESITKMNYIPIDDITIETIPINERSLLFVIFIYIDDEEQIKFVIELDLQDGIRRFV